MVDFKVDERTNRTKIKKEDIASYHKNGYLIIPGFFSNSVFLERVLNEIDQLGKLFLDDFKMSDASPLRMSTMERSSLYSALRYLPSLTMLASSDLLTDVSRQLGLSMPAVMHSYNIRMDVPNETKFLLHWHQDVSYLLGSFNSLTYWLPLGKTDAHHGSVALIPGSHCNGLAPVRYTQNGEPPPTKGMSQRDLVLIDEPTTPGQLIDVELGDLVVFSQFILHRSTPNYSDRVRWTIQIRHSDLGEPQFIAAGYPFGDNTNLFHNRYLSRENKR